MNQTLKIMVNIVQKLRLIEWATLFLTFLLTYLVYHNIPILATFQLMIYEINIF
jgi:hypothetical protein